MQTRRETLRVLAATAGSALAGPAFTQQDDWDKVVADAKKEGEILVYSAIAGAKQPPEIGRMFEQKYGIRFRLLDGRPTEIHERIRIEASSNRPAGDLTLNGSTTLVLLREQGLLAPRPSVPNFTRLVLEPSQPEEIPVFALGYCILVNTKLVPAGEEPKSWLDLLDPKWKGKILSDEMRATGAGATLFGVLQDRFGTEFHEKLAKQELVWSRQIQENPRRIARGEYAIYIPLIMTFMNGLEALPIKPVIPEEGVAYTPFAVAAIKNAPHPNASRLFANFILEPEAQLVFARDGYAISTGGLQDKTPEKWRWSVNAKLLGRQKLVGQQERLQLADKIYHGK